MYFNNLEEIELALEKIENTCPSKLNGVEGVEVEEAGRKGLRAVLVDEHGGQIGYLDAAC